MGILTACKPRKEVLEGDLGDAIFAADFGDLIAGETDAPAVYGDAATFFENTHPAKDLKRLVTEVFGRLAKKGEGGAAIRLSTGFGGGKTHALMALWHLGKNISKLTLGTELLPAAGRPKSVAVVAVDGSKAGSPVFLRHGAVEVKSLQGEIAYQLGGAAAVKKLGKADAPDAQPNEPDLKALFPDGPVLILLDELVVYVAGLSEQAQKNALAVLGKLASIATKRPQTVLVVSDPGTQRVYQKVSAAVEKEIKAAADLDETLGRKHSGFNPIGDESARVLSRRLFESIDPGAAQAASATYHALYQRVAEEHPDLVPPVATTPDYARRIVESYPFHPRFLDTARDRLGALQSFQQSRGVLRLFARILRDTWERKADVDLITAGDLDWGSARIQADLLQRLDRELFRASVSADVEGHARELDSGGRGVHHRVASALLFESLPMNESSGLTPDELTLAVLRPDEAGPEPSEALDHLVGVCWHTYPTPGGRGWRFRYDPNVIKQIEERRAQVLLEDAEARLQSEAQAYFGGVGFRLRAWPENPKQVPETVELQLALCHTPELAQSVCQYVDDTDPAGRLPRRFINAMCAVTAKKAAYDNAVSRAQALLAAEEIEKEYRTGEAGAAIRDQLKRLKPELERQFKIQTRRAFDQVVLSGNQTFSIDETFQGGDEEILRQPRGQEVLRRFLEDKELLFASTHALDPLRFVRDFLPGAVPQPGKAGVYSARAVYERLLGAPGLRLISDEEVARRTLLKAVQAGKVVIRLPDGRVFDTKGAVEGPPAARRRVTGATLPGLPLADGVLVAIATSEAAAAWVKETGASGRGPHDPPPPPPPPPPPGRIITESLAEAIELAVTRPLLGVRLIADATAKAAKLAAIAQPLGAETVAVTVTAGGDLRAGGTMSFAAEGVKLTHPARPLETAALVANSLADGSTYEALLMLTFGASGRAGMQEPLRRLTDVAEDLRLSFEFGPPTTGDAA